MTVGEKIQHYRKRAGLSQEELGQQLLVSRQTVSLWETGQTMPTLDNLIRLRAIFGVSVDELLCEQEQATHGDALPMSDAQGKTYSSGALRSILRHMVCEHLWWLFLALGLLLVNVPSLILDQSWMQICVTLCPALWVAFEVSLLILRIKRARKITECLRRSTYFCEIIDGQVCFVLKDGETVRECYCEEASETRVQWQSDSVICVAIQLGLIYVERDFFRENAELGELWQKKGETVPKKRHTARPTLLAACISGALAFLATAFLWVYGAPGTLNVSALILLIAVVPALICAATGVFWRKLERPYRLLNTLIGSLLALVLACGGIFTIFAVLPRPVRDTQKCLGVEIPACESVSLTSGEYVSDDLYLYYRADFYLDADEALVFENDLTKIGSPFVTPKERAMIYAPTSAFGQGAESFLLFDAQESEAISELTGKGYHEYFLFAYYPQEHLLSVAKCNLYVSE